nr:MAG TPA: hypothetical protein [Caudoviricetes sp.]
MIYKEFYKLNFSNHLLIFKTHKNFLKNQGLLNMQNRRILRIGGSAPAPTALRSQEVPFRITQCKDGPVFTFAAIPFDSRPRPTGATFNSKRLIYF